ncbi:MAG: hypothetical protein WCR31_10315 [Treponema sp.]
MKKILLPLIISLFFFFSCGTTQPVKQEVGEIPVDTTSVHGQETPVPVNKTPEAGKETPVPADETPQTGKETPVPADETPKAVQKTEVPVTQTPVPVLKAPAPGEKASDSVQVSPAPVKNDDEYHRSVNDIEVTKETFAEDKTEIMEIISKLAGIMAEGDYDAWVKYIDEDSVKYWSNPQNLRKASKMLPVKGLYMNNLHDYFTYVFVPSRKGREVDEIRYISKNNVKAVEVNENADIIYYYFKKIDNTWFVHIPPL